ncbi:MAG TPA: lamin tail domain-containing protein [Candidatus Nanoarchaeia archaeon]|nr:lamin tail domain-containing protein [Candidatus Nanoarchaeia archaeon]
MKKSLLFIVLLLSLSFLFVSSVNAKDVAYIVANNRINQDFVQTLNSLSLTYDIVSDANLNNTNLSSYGMLLIGDQLFNILNANIVNSHNSLVVNPNYVDEFGYSSRNAIQLGGSQPMKIRNINENHSINQGMPLEIQVYTTCCEGSASVPIYALRKIYTLVRMTKVDSTMNDPGDSVIAVVPPGVRLLNGITTQGRNVFFGVTESKYWTQNARNLFKNSILWTLNGNDLDGDGYFSDDDCDDNNPNINPSGIEIPYDNIDQDCSGSDLNDLDEDGFSSNVVGGLDCNDNDENINPDAREIVDNIDQNCRNDPPLLRSNFPGSLNINEDSQLVNIFDLDSFFADYENDILTFNVINNTNIDAIINNDNKVTLKPNLNFYGNNSIKFISTDDQGATTSSNVIMINVNPVNDRPVLEEINILKVVATNTLILSPAASDVENDTLIFTYNAPFNDQGIWTPRINDVGEYTSSIRVSDGRLSESDSFTVIVEPKVVINEVEVNPEGADDGNEWIEIFNPSNQTVNLSLWYLKDNANHTINVDVESLNANSYYVLTLQNALLNNQGDSLKLYNYRNELVDETPLLKDELDSEFSWSRKPNGIDNNQGNDWNLQKPTKSFTNDADLIPPVVTLVAPVNNYFSEVNELSFAYLATDNLAQNFNCYFYSNLNSTNSSIMERLAEFPTRNNVENRFRVRFIPDGVFKWNILCRDQYVEAFAPLDNVFKVDMNYPPVIQDISDIIINETEIIRIEVTATDQDQDEVTLAINDDRFTKENNIFTYLTNYNDAGVFFVNISASDGNLTTIETIKITVNNLNRLPVFGGIISDVVFDEDVSYIINMGELFSDPDNEDLSYRIEGSDKIELSFDDDEITLKGKQDFNGEVFVKIVGIDVNGGEALSNEFKVTLNAVNDAPRIRTFSPFNLNPAIAEFDEITFSVETYDVDSNSLDLKWFVDNQQLGSGNSFVFRGDGTVKDYEIKVEISDNEFATSNTWNLKVSDHPITNYFDGDTTNFNVNSNELVSMENVIIEKRGIGKINIKGPVDMSNIVDLDSNILVMPYLVGINSNRYTEFSGKNSTITLYGLLFNGIPTIYYTNIFTSNFNEISQECPSIICSNIIYNPDSRILSFDVSGFSTFKIGNPNPKTCSQLNGDICSVKESCNGNLLPASDSNSCCSVQCSRTTDEKEINLCSNLISDKIRINLKDPNKNDEFKLGEKVNVKLDIKNNDDLDKDVIVEVTLYDEKSNDDLDDENDDKTVNKKDNEEFEFELEVPDDPNDIESDELILAVKAYEDGKEDSVCQQESINLKVNIEDDDLRIKNAEFFPSTLSCSMETKLNVNVVNYGNEDQEAVLSVSNSQLKISKSSEVFNVESFDSDDNSISKDVGLNLENVKPGVYDFTVNLEYNGQIDSVNVPLEVVECGKTTNFIENQQVKKIKDKVVSSTKSIKNSSKISVLAGSNSSPKKTVRKEEIDEIVFFEPLPEGSASVIFLAAFNILLLIGITYMLKLHILKK